VSEPLEVADRRGGGVAVHTGAGALRCIADGLDDLHATTDTPVTARRRWLQAWIDCYPAWTPLVVTVGVGDRLDAVAPLAWHRGSGITTVVGVGEGPSDYLAFPARDPAAATALAGAVCTALHTLPRPWRLVVRGLPAADPVAARLAATAPVGAVVPGPSARATAVVGERELRAYVRTSERRELRRMRNRVARRGHTSSVEVLADPDEVAAVLPEVESVHRARDAALGRASRLDDRCAGPFFRRVLLDHAAAGEVEVDVLRFDGRLAAYVVSFPDGPVRRAWNTRFDPAFADLGPGRTALCGALERAVADPTCEAFDWMLGDEAYKRSYVMVEDPREELLAWSSSGARLALDAPRRVRAALRPLKRRYGVLDRGWERAKHTAKRARGGR
jgi:CelD/BcsL family acetyltransferase involved in cellulose biosynthesis